MRRILIAIRIVLILLIVIWLLPKGNPSELFTWKNLQIFISALVLNRLLDYAAKKIEKFIKPKFEKAKDKAPWEISGGLPSRHQSKENNN